MVYVLIPFSIVAMIISKTINLVWQYVLFKHSCEVLWIFSCNVCQFTHLFCCSTHAFDPAAGTFLYFKKIKRTSVQHMTMPGFLLLWGLTGSQQLSTVKWTTRPLHQLRQSNSLLCGACVVHGFDSCSSRHAGTLGKFLTHNYLWRFGVKLRHSIRAVSGAPLSSSGLEEVLWK